jgi:hypothetical protein
MMLDSLASFLGVDRTKRHKIYCHHHDVTDDRRKSNRAIAIVRPPGHHATRDEAMGKSVKDILTIQSCDFLLLTFD